MSPRLDRMAVIPLLTLVLLLIALIDIILRTGDQIRHLPKAAWVFIVILLPVIGSALWFAFGRVYSGPLPRRPGRPRSVVVHEHVRRPSSTEEQLAALEREIADDRIRQLENELRRRHDA